MFHAHRHLARNLRLARLTAGLTQHELATRAGQRQADISLIELGRFIPTSREVEQLAAALGVTTALLLRPSRAKLLEGARRVAA